MKMQLKLRRVPAKIPVLFSLGIPPDETRVENICPFPIICAFDSDKIQSRIGVHCTNRGKTPSCYEPIEIWWFAFGSAILPMKFGNDWQQAWDTNEGVERCLAGCSGPLWALQDLCVRACVAANPKPKGYPPLFVSQRFDLRPHDVQIADLVLIGTHATRSDDTIGKKRQFLHACTQDPVPSGLGDPSTKTWSDQFPKQYKFATRPHCANGGEGA